MEIAVMFGVVPAVVLASQVSTHLFHADKLDVSGALLGQPLDVVQCKTVDIEVLAEAEIVLEGKILPHERDRKELSESSAVIMAGMSPSRLSK